MDLIENCPFRDPSMTFYYLLFSLKILKMVILRMTLGIFIAYDMWHILKVNNLNRLCRKTRRIEEF